MRLAVAALLAAVTVPAYQASSAPLTAAQRTLLVDAHEWHAGCPVPLSGLRVLSVSYWGFDRKPHQGQMVVNANAVAPLTKVFGRLYEMRFPIRYMSLADAYGPSQPAGGDVTASFECRDAVPSPCNGNAKGTNWSMHAYGEAVDLDPRENPYVGCGMTRDKTARSYMKRSHVRPGMVTPAIYERTFATIGWGWGGLWTGSTKDYMHFSVNGH